VVLVGTWHLSRPNQNSELMYLELVTDVLESLLRSAVLSLREDSFYIAG